MGYIGPNFKIPSELAESVESTRKDVDQLLYSSYNKNIIINSDFHVDQRGWAGIVQPTNAAWWPADCWTLGISKDSAVTVNNLSESLDLTAEYVSGVLPSRYGLKITCSNTASGSQMVATSLVQRNEKWDFCSGEKVTFSFYAKADSECDVVAAVASLAALNASIAANYPLYTKVRIGTSWKRYSFTFNMADLSETGWSTVNGVRYLAISLSPISINAGSPVGDVNSTGIPISFTCVQLEKGDLSDYSSYRTEAEEVIRCYRYLYIPRGSFELSPNNQSTAVTNRVNNIQFPIPMRSTPSCQGEVYNMSTAATANAIFSNIKETGVTAYAAPASLSFTVAQTVSVRKLLFSCEF